MTDNVFEPCMMGLAVNYGLDLENNPPDQAFAAMLKETLAPYPDEAVKHAFLRVLRKVPWRPKISDFIEALEGSPKKAADAAWAEVLGALNTYEGLRNKRWRVNGATAEAVKCLGGWGHLSQMHFIALDKLKDSFAAVYERAAAQNLDRQAGAVVGKRDRDWRTGELLPLTNVAPLSAINAPTAIGQQAPPMLENHKR